MEVKKHYASLSEAMRAGIPLKPQAFGELFINGGSCALGAAMDATLKQPNCFDYTFDYFERLYHLVMSALSHCPVDDCGCGERDVTSIGFAVTHLNDHHRWTREQIADWLEKEEEKLGFVHVVETEALNSDVFQNRDLGTAQAGVLK
jgi:hypothetical protein